MFDIGWVEMMIVVVVMIVVIGPKDLPVVLQTIGRWIARLRGMARGFQDNIEEMARETGLEDMRNEINSIQDFSIEDEIEKAVDPDGKLGEGLQSLGGPKQEDDKAEAETADKPAPEKEQ